jgi:hypothetical protein
MTHGDGMMGFWMHGPGGFGLLHWLAFILFVAAIAYPIGVILKRLGHSPLWAALAFVPFVNIVGLWIVALRKPERPASPI